MQYINPNYHSWAALPLINIRVDNDYINNVFVGINEIDYNHIYVLINNYGNNSSIKYIEELIDSSDYICHENVNIDLVLFTFKISDKKEYINLINGNYDNISEKYHTHADNFIADCVRTTREGFYNLYKMLFLILDNSEQLISDYWVLLFDDADNWLIKEIQKSKKYFSAVSVESNNLLTNYKNNVLNSSYEF